ncbi:MAG TPA: Crp/Fnr family transcriptional regulator [Defluviitaleaceae bacterium]|nr:Crp/Fnr family transcriptional regulator [Candidatus Epulonipiscium sp.]HOA81688.1 Crp/Fnr family transcriptional regulator [Defluviitaleaceae bacterium]
MEKRINLLKRIPVFSKLSDEQLMDIVELEIKKDYKKGSIIFYEGDKGDAFYYIQSGKVKMYKTDYEGKEIILNIFGEGSIIGEVTMFNDIEYPATAEVIEDAVVGMIYNNEIENLVANNKDLALQIIKELTKRLYNSQMNVKEMALSSVYLRTKNVILNLAKDHGVKTTRGIELNLDITRQDIANIVGTTRETVSRVLSELKKAEDIDIKGKKIIIKDIDDFV